MVSAERIRWRVRNTRRYGTLKLAGVEDYDVTAYCDSAEQAEDLLATMVDGYQKGLKQRGAWGDHVRSCFVKKGAR